MLASEIMKKYIDISNYEAKWMFEDEIPVSAIDLKRIKPLTEDYSSRIWSKYISSENRHPMLLKNHEWPCLSSTWNITSSWQEEWNSDNNDLPNDLEHNIQWHYDSIIYFAYCKESIIETTWSVFKRNWKCFLFDI